MKQSFRYLDVAEVDQLSTLSEVLVRINRCAVVVKGGRRFSFSALSVSGNRGGVVGIGFGKGRQVPGAIEKAGRDARKHLMRVPVTPAGSIPHEVEAGFCGALIRLVPASPGTGIIAGASVRAVCEMAGIKNILTKSYGSTNPVNLVKATLLALSRLRTEREVGDLREVELRAPAPPADAAPAAAALEGSRS
jgi:small subunit ribosomal protein S5